jgi:phage terminase small subunit
VTGKQKAFVNAYFKNNFNATKAAEKAGYANPTDSGYQTKNNPEVAAEIERRFKEHAAGADEVLAVLASQMRSSIADVIVIQEGNSYPIFDAQKAHDTGAIHNIKKMTRTVDGSVSVEMYSKHDAAVTIGRHLKLWTDRTEHSGGINVTEASDEELEAILQG